MLICDKRRPRTRRGYQYQAPQGGRIKTAPASGPRLGRSLAWGGTPRPPGLRPLARLRAPGPCCLGHPAGGFRAQVRRWRGWATACGCPCPTPSPWRFSGFWRNSKRGPCRGTAGGSGACPRCRAAVGNPAQAVGGQGAAACGCARRPRTGRGCPRATGLQEHTCLVEL